MSVNLSLLSQQRQMNILHNGVASSTMSNRNEFSLCLTRHYAIKTYWGSGSISPRIIQ